MWLIATYSQRQASDNWIVDNTWFDTLVKRIMIHQTLWISLTLTKGTCFNLLKTRLHGQQPGTRRPQEPGYRAAIAFHPILQAKVFYILTNLADFTNMHFPYVLMKSWKFGPNWSTPWEELHFVHHHLTCPPRTSPLYRRLTRFAHWPLITLLRHIQCQRVQFYITFIVWYKYVLVSARVPFTFHTQMCYHVLRRASDTYRVLNDRSRLQVFLWTCPQVLRELLLM